MIFIINRNCIHARALLLNKKKNNMRTKIFIGFKEILEMSEIELKKEKNIYIFVYGKIKQFSDFFHISYWKCTKCTKYLIQQQIFHQTFLRYDLSVSKERIWKKVKINLRHVL